MELRQHRLFASLDRLAHLRDGNSWNAIFSPKGFSELVLGQAFLSLCFYGHLTRSSISVWHRHPEVNCRARLTTCAHGSTPVAATSARAGRQVQSERKESRYCRRNSITLPWDAQRAYRPSVCSPGSRVFSG